MAVVHGRSLRVYGVRQSFGMEFHSKVQTHPRGTPLVARGQRNAAGSTRTARGPASVVDRPYAAPSETRHTPNVPALITMALVTEFTCRECRQPKHEVVVPSRICTICRTAISEAKETAHMQRLAALPIEERVRRLELELYRLDTDSRLKALEVVVNIRY